MDNVFGPIRQIGYVTRDAAKSMHWWHDNLGIGPWYYFDGALDVTYGGIRSSLDLTIGFANSGATQIEIIEQRNDAPSAFRRVLSQPFALHQVHHYAFWPGDYDRSVDLARARGFVVSQEVHVNRGRVTYWQSTDPAGLLVELAEGTPSRQATRDRVAAAATEWDGNNPLRPLD